MKLVELKDVVRKAVALHYRNEYAATAVFQTNSGTSVIKRIEFIIEMDPLGQKSIRVKFIDTLDYPLVPILKPIKEEILNLDRKGILL